MSKSIGMHRALGTRSSIPAGGDVLWVELPAQHSSMALFHDALNVGIQISPGDIFSNTRRFHHFMRIGCGAPYSPRIDEALQTLARLLKNQG